MAYMTHVARPPLTRHTYALGAFVRNIEIRSSAAVFPVGEFFVGRRARCRDTFASYIIEFDCDRPKKSTIRQLHA